MRTLLTLFLCLAAFQCNADERSSNPADAKKDALIADVLGMFWGNARDSKGEVIQPTSDLDRRTVPIPTRIAYRAIDAGRISGEASVCGLRWKSHYLSITAAARKLGMSDKQVAFVSFLHGMRQGQVMSSTRPACSETDRRLAANHLDASTRLGLETAEL